MPEDNAANDMIRLIELRSNRAKRGHRGLVLPDKDGSLVPMNQLFDKPVEFMAAMVRSGWNVPFAPEKSLLLTTIIGNDGPMRVSLDDSDVGVIRRWIEDGAKIPS